MGRFEGAIATSSNDGSWVVDLDRGGHIRIETDFTLVDANSGRSLASEIVRSEVASSLSGRVDAVTWNDDAVMSVRYESSVVVELAADPDYEAWTVTDPAGALVVSMPGGGLTTYPPW